MIETMHIIIFPLVVMLSNEMHPDAAERHHTKQGCSNVWLCRAATYSPLSTSSLQGWLFL